MTAGRKTVPETYFVQRLVLVCLLPDIGYSYQQQLVAINNLHSFVSSTCGQSQRIRWEKREQHTSFVPRLTSMVILSLTLYCSIRHRLKPNRSTKKCLYNCLNSYGLAFSSKAANGSFLTQQSSSYQLQKKSVSNLPDISRQEAWS